MYQLTGLPGWMRFGYSPGWGGMPPGAQSLMESGLWPQFWSWFQSQRPYPAWPMISPFTAYPPAPGLPAELLAQAGVDVLLCAGLGHRAMALFEEHGVMVYTGAYGTAREVLERWKGGELRAATDEDICHEHRFRRHEHP